MTALIDWNVKEVQSAILRRLAQVLGPEYIFSEEDLETRKDGSMYCTSKKLAAILITEGFNTVEAKERLERVEKAALFLKSNIK